MGYKSKALLNLPNIYQYENREEPFGLRCLVWTIISLTVQLILGGSD
jgi:hypothetical protein